MAFGAGRRLVIARRDAELSVVQVRESWRGGVGNGGRAEMGKALRGTGVEDWREHFMCVVLGAGACW